jgi:glycerol uptake operon antiterminator
MSRRNQSGAHFSGQRVLPAIRKIRDVDDLVASELHYVVFLDLHLGQVQALAKLMRQHGKKILLHADLIQGLKNDQYAAEFLCQQIRPDGLISTRADVLKTAKQHEVLAIQRLFLLDTIALETSFQLARKVEPDYIEVLPGVIPQYVDIVKQETGIPVIAGGLIKSSVEMEQILAAGAEAITTSRKELWSGAAPRTSF